MASQELASRPTCDSTLRKRHFFSQGSNTCDPQRLCNPASRAWFPPATQLQRRNNELILTQAHHRVQQWSYRPQWPSTPVCMWTPRSRQPTWGRLSWTISSRTFSCSQEWSGRAEWWWARRGPRRSVSGRSPAQRTHFYALLDETYLWVDS